MFKKVLLFWIAYWLAQSILMSQGNNLLYFLSKSIGMVILQAAVAWINWSFLLPSLFEKKRYIIYTIASILLIYLVYVFSFELIEKVMFAANSIFPQVKLLNFDLDFAPKFWSFLSGSAPYSLSLVCSTIVKQLLINNQNKTEIERIKLDNAQTQLEHLSAQINPHFLFNSLNNIHALTITDHEKAGDYTLHLSELMRYMLYDVKNGKVPIRKELEIIKKYIQLVELRSEVSLSETLSLNIKNNERQIHPLLLFSIIENGVKHSGIEHLKNAKLTISIIENSDGLSLEMKNSVFKNKADDHEGIGMDNLKRRLYLLYKDMFTFNFKIENKEAITRLKIRLND